MSAPQLPGPQQWGPGVVPEASMPTQPAAPPSAAEKWEASKPLVRLVGSLTLAVLALLTLAQLAPDPLDADRSGDRVTIWLDDAANQERTEGAPQQAVVNGWTGNALLDLISEQLDARPAPDPRPSVLLTLGVLLLALHVATGGTSPRLRSALRS